MRCVRRIGDVDFMSSRAFEGDLFLLDEVVGERELIVGVDALDLVVARALGAIDAAGVLGSYSICVGEPNVK